MKKIIVLCIMLALTLSMFSCGGGGAGSSSSPDGENPKAPSIVRLMPSHYVAQTNSFISLHTKVLDGNGKPVPNTPVTYTNLSNPFGEIISSMLKFLGLYKPVGMLSTSVVKTDKLGIATVKITSTVSGFATVQSEVNTGFGIVRDQKTVFFTTSTASTTTPPPTLTLHVDDGNGKYDEPADFDLLKNSSDNTRTIKAVVLDGFGVPFSGVSVTFGSDSPDEVTFDRETVLTGSGNEAGNAYVVMTVNQAKISKFKRYINIFASADTNGNGTFETGGMLTLFLEPVTVSSITVSANPAVIAPDATSTITAVVYLSSGTPVPDGSTVSFATSPAGCGFVSPFSQTSAGIATATYTAPSSVPATNPCTVIASIGGKSGETTVRITTELTVQPSTQTINGTAGGSSVFKVFGGSPPYSVFSDNANIIFQPTPNVLPESGDLFTVTIPKNTTQNTVRYTIRDSRGDTVQATLEVLGAGSLLVSPPSITISGIVEGDAIFYVFGGTPPYTVIPDNADPVFKPLIEGKSDNIIDNSGGAFKIHLIPRIGTLQVFYTIVDAAGDNITALLNIQGPQAMVVFPQTQTIVDPTTDPAVTDPARHRVAYTIIGGSPFDTAPFYNAVSNKPDLVTLSMNGSTLTAEVKGVPQTDTTVLIDIYDSIGSKVTVQLILDVPPLKPLTVIPEAQTIPNPHTAPNPSTATIHVMGGVPGTTGYLAYSSDPGLLSVAVNGSTVTATVEGVPATDTTVTITIFDSEGSSVASTVILDLTPVRPLAVIPSAQALASPATSATYEVLGGTGGYQAFSGTPSLVTVAMTSANVLTATVVAYPTTDTTVTITVYDSAGNNTTASLLLDVAPIATLSVIPTPQTINGVSGGTAVYTIFGGVAPYTVYTSNPLFPPDTATVPASGSPFSVVVNPNTPTTTVTYTIRDSAGTTTTATLNVSGTSISVLPSAQTVNGAPGGTATFRVFGGNPTYEVFTSNPAFQPVPATGLASGDTFDVTVPPNTPATSVTYTIRDSAGNSGGPVTLSITFTTTDFYVMPEAATFSVGGSMTFTVFGGNEPFDFFVNNNELVAIVYDTLIDPRSFTVIGLASGSVTVTLRDEDGRQKTVNVTVQ